MKQATRKRTRMISVAVGAYLMAGQAWSATYTWNVANSGNWDNTTATGWNVAGYPSAAGDSAVISKNITADQTVTINVANAKVGSLTLTDVTPSNNWTIASSNPATNKLTFDNGASTAALSSTTLSNVINAPIVLASNLGVTVGAGTATQLTLSGPISDGGASKGLTLSAGTLILSNSNSFSGTTALPAGTLQLSNTGALTNSAVSLSGGTLRLRSDTNNATFGTAGITVTAATTVDVGQASTGSGNLLQLGAISFTGGSNFTATGANSYALGIGAVNLNNSTGGLITFKPSTANLTIASLTGNAGAGKLNNFKLDGTAGNNAVTGVIDDGSGGGQTQVTKTNSSTWTLSGNNTFTGGVLMTWGTLRLNNDGALNSSTANGITFGPITATTATLSLNGHTTTIGALSSSGVGTSIIENGNANPVTLTVSQGTAGTYSGTIQDGAGGGALSLVKTGLLTLTISGTNTYTGSTTVNAGSLKLNNGNDILPTGTTLAVNGGPSSSAYGTLDLNARNQTVAMLTGGSGASPGIVLNNSAGGTSVLTVTGTSQFDGILKDGGASKVLGLTKSVGGVLTLTGANAYSGATTVSGGTLTAGALNTLSSSSDYTISGGTLDVSAHANKVKSLTLASGTLALGVSNVLASSSASTFGSGTVTVTGSATSGSYQLMTFPSRTGTALAGTLPDGYRLATNTTELDLIHKAAFGTVTPQTGLQIISGGSTPFSFTVQNNAPTSSDSLSFSAGVGGDVSGSASGTASANSISASITGLSFSSTTVGTSVSGSFAVTDPNAYGGTSASGTVSVNVWDHASPGTPSTTSIDFGSHHVGYAGPVAGASITVGNNSGHRVDLAGTGESNNHVTLGNLAATAPGTSNSVTTSLSSGRGAGPINESLKLAYSDSSSLNGVSNTLGHSTITLTGNIYTGQSAYTGGGTWNSFSNWTTAGGVPGIDGGLSAGNDTATFDNTGAASPNVSLDTSVQLNTLTINSGTSYAINPAADQSITLSGTGAALNITGTHAIGAAVNFASDTLVTVNGGSTVTFGGELSKNGTVLTMAGGGHVIVNGVISGALPHSDYVIDGATVDLNTAATYDGPTSIMNTGVLNLGVNNALPSGTTVSLSNGSTLNVGGHSLTVTSLQVDATSSLTGTGTINAPVTILGTADISPAGTGSIGTLSVSSLTVNGTYLADISGLADADRLNIGGALDLSGASLNLHNMGITGSVYVIAHYGTLSGTFGSEAGLPDGAKIVYNYRNGNDIAVLIPEPAALSLLGLSGAMLLCRRNRRNAVNRQG